MRVGDEMYVVSRGVEVIVVWVGICNALVRCACGNEFEVPFTDLVGGPDDEHRGDDRC